VRPLLSLPVWIGSLATLAAPVAGDEVISFREAWGWAVVVKVRVGASGAHDFLLDTGSASTLVEPALAEELGIEASARTRLVTPAGARMVGVGRASLRVGAATLPDVEVLIAELPAIRSDEPAVRGILGQSALDRLDYTIDHARRRLVVHDWHVATATGPDGPTRPTLEARLGCGRSSARFVLDSGVSTPVLFRRARRSLDLELGGSVQVQTNAGRAAWRAARLSSLCVGGWRTAPVNVVVRPEDAPAREEDGLLPTRFFARVHLGPKGALIGVDHWP